MQKYDVRLIIERMKEKISAQNDKVLAALLEVPSTNISNWRSRNSLPLEYVTDFAEKTNVSTDWLLFGKNTSAQLDAAQIMALTAFNLLDEHQKVKAIAFMSGLKAEAPQTERANPIYIGGNANNVAGRDQIIK